MSEDYCGWDRGRHNNIYTTTSGSGAQRWLTAKRGASASGDMNEAREAGMGSILFWAEESINQSQVLY